MANLHIIPFIQSLSETEVKIAEDHLFRSQPLFGDDDKKGSKEYRLFKYIVANREKTISDAEILSELDIKDLTHLKVHLYNKVLEAVTFDKYLTNTDIFTEYDTASFLVRKKILAFKSQFRVVNKGKTEALKELLNEVISTSKQFEIYDVLVEALIAKKYFFSIREGIDAFNKANEEITFYNYCYEAGLRTNDYYYNIILNKDFTKALTENELDKYLKKALKQIEADFRKTQSEQINYFLHIIRFAGYEREKNYKKAIDVCNKLILLIRNSKILFRNERMGFALDNLSVFNTHIGTYDIAAKNSRNAQSYYVEGSLNFIVSKEQELLAYIYGREFESAEVALNVLLSHSLIDAGEFRKSKFTYYKACILFETGRFKEALSILNESLEIEKDKSRWNISIRILQIQLFIELDKINEASHSLESLRKYMERTGKNEEIRERDENIVRLLREMEKNGFHYDASNKTAAAILEQLSDKKGKLAWEHYSPELIRFHEWVMRK